MKNLKSIINVRQDVDLSLVLSDLIKNEEIRLFVNAHKITDMLELENGIPQMLSFLTYKKRCEGCKGLNACKQATLGYEPTLIREGSIQMIYQECKFLRARIEQETKARNLVFYHVGIEKTEEEGKVLGTKERGEVLSYLLRFIKEFKRTHFMKGLYLHGSFGTGKTFLLLDVARKLASKGFRVIFAYYPNLVREIKSSIGSNSLEPIIAELKDADVLMLDDIGGESNSAFIRDEVLGPVLQFRMDAKKPVFFTSNLGIIQLEEHFSSTSSSSDKVKASRIIERIEAVAIPMYLAGSNYRRNE